MRIYLMMALLLLPLAPGCAKPQNTAARDRDNTAVNQRDAGNEQKTPLDQNENKVDIELTASIRRQLQKEDISIDAKNAKIITQDGMVTLRGPVKSAEEKALLERIAKDLAGEGKVDSKLEIAP